MSSPVGINCEIVEDGVNGFYARSHGEWVSCLERLIQDRALRHRMGQAGRRKMQACYSLERSSLRLFRILSSMAREDA